MGTPLYRIIGGKKYKAKRWGVTKAKAKEVAEMWRHKGESARVIKEADGYTVYVRLQGRKMAGKSKKSTIVSVRLDNEVVAKLRRLHPNICEYLRQRIEYDITRKHKRWRPIPKPKQGKLSRKEIEMQAYCVKCRAKREMKDPKDIVMKNGKPATQGVCPVCGTKMFRIGRK